MVSIKTLNWHDNIEMCKTNLGIMLRLINLSCSGRLGPVVRSARLASLFPPGVVLEVTVVSLCFVYGRERE